MTVAADTDQASDRGSSQPRPGPNRRRLRDGRGRPLVEVEDQDVADRWDTATPARRRAAVAPLLVAAIGGHPWPTQLTLNWRSKPTGYHQVTPLAVVEIRADIATDQGRRWRHAVRMLRVRDIAPDEVPLDLDLEA